MSSKHVTVAVLETIADVAKEQDCDLASLSDTTPLLESGLDSLCLAIVVARLEERLGFDPFSEAEDMILPITIGDLIGAYARAEYREPALVSNQGRWA